ncbi:hypothetical protein Mpt1_c08370 [Candidatus Methanoplasma termitum]|uniref:DUF1016 domain-containing protein n=1 Tax=Candidatus Methanoplasma termitum TaxID=1577791 RepID=A0A0A7LCC1_9ARCH|nr:PDDEXK nuclease domain-containing protein [Candidatus Methanoplasma termitum]AIZ56714.1 hypothetical protein Mpt1_c08370 [Candidatus Methanoplasma termitum]MCL2333352.1 PDDEXK nuclease domain-containing protein [Candidatus Methanoplasma sp.]
MTKTSKEKENSAVSTSNILDDAKQIIEDSRRTAYRAVNTALVQRNWLLGKRIAEEELHGDRKTDYGKDIINKLSKELTYLYGKGYSESNLYYFTQFYKIYPDIFHSACGQSLPLLPWSHYRTLVQVEDKKARDWYLKEASEQSWSVESLKRNISSQYYYRLLSTQNPAPTDQENKEITEPYKRDALDFVKNPVLMEFFGSDRNVKINESRLESRIIGNMQKFLLELGKGYAFIARQQRIQTGNQVYFIDLVFYNVFMRCYVLVDLKTSKVTPRDIGQMDMYVRLYDEFRKTSEQNPTLGIIMCSETDSDVAHYSMLNGNEQLFATKYMTYLPSEEELRAEIEAQKKVFFLQLSEPKEGHG